MPDTKKGRERSGLTKRAQLEAELAEREAAARDEPDVSPLEVDLEELLDEGTDD
jgi:hypothetical protein